LPLISYYRRIKKQMKKRMAILMSMAIAANMIASVPVCAADIFTDSMTTDSHRRQMMIPLVMDREHRILRMSRRMYRWLRMRVHKV